MNPILNRNLFFIKEHTGVFKAANNYDIFDPENSEMLMNCREENMGGFTKFLRFTDYKRMTPFHIEIKTMTGDMVLTVKRGTAFFGSTVEVYNEQSKLVGKFKQKLFSLGGKFLVLDANEQEICTLKGKWTSWDFRFMKGETEFAHVSKKWGGLGKEMFTSADDYMLEIADEVPQDNPIRVLILAAVMCIDMVLKE